MDKRRNKKSKEEIAKEFDLPERKSKIATIMKQDGQAYCVCRTSDCSRFMIGCDGCEEWYHGDCINITEKDAKYIKQYFCQKCRQEDSNLQIVFRLVAFERRSSTSTGANGSSTEVADKRRKTKDITSTSNATTSATTAANAKPGKRCGTCDACRRPNCNRCEACLQRVSHKPRCMERVCMNQRPRQPYNAVSRKKEKTIKERSRKRNRSISPDVFINPELEGLRQCHGPGCLNNARPQSKYCSDQCGIKLATSRIFHMLTPRLQERNLTPCRAAEENKKQLEQVRKKQLTVRRALSDLDVRQSELDMIVARAKSSTIDPKGANENNDVEDEQSMYCITCGHEIHSRTAIKHMEKCFNKYESQASFGSIFKTRIEGNSMFCDFYNTASKTYCKRLRVLCPEHSKDPKVSDTDVCGAPQINDNFCLTGEYCRAPKKNCFKHYAWEKLRRAEIDLERVRQWLKLDELVEQERQIRQQMSNRAGLLGLMLHSTYDHEVLEELVRKQQEHILAMQKVGIGKTDHRKKYQKSQQNRQD